jgi:hypothetical protein
MKITNFKARAAQYDPPKGWDYDMTEQAVVRIPESEAGFRPEADAMTPEIMEQYYAALENSVAAAIDEKEFSASWQRDQNNSSAAQNKGHPLKGTGLA